MLEPFTTQGIKINLSNTKDIIATEIITSKISFIKDFFVSIYSNYTKEKWSIDDHFWNYLTSLSLADLPERSFK